MGGLKRKERKKTKNKQQPGRSSKKRERKIFYNGGENVHWGRATSTGQRGGDPNKEAILARRIFCSQLNRGIKEEGKKNAK